MRTKLPDVFCTKIPIHSNVQFDFNAEVFTIEGSPEPDHAYMVRNGVTGEETSLYSVTFEDESRTIKVTKIGKHEIIPFVATKFLNLLRTFWVGAQITYV